MPSLTNQDFKEKIFNYTSSTAIVLVGASWVVMFYAIIKNQTKTNH